MAKFIHISMGIITTFFGWICKKTGQNRGGADEE